MIADTEQIELIELAHEPVMPPRASTPGEGIYLGLWREYLEARPDQLDRILAATLYSNPTQREATVCASFMTFMGCACGAGFTFEAERMLGLDYGAAYRSPSTIFHMAWAVENRRSMGVNRGLRTVEAMLARDLWIYRKGDVPQVNWEAVDAITPRDYDTVECMVEWWSGEDAKGIRRIARPLIDAAQERLRSNAFKSDQDKQ